MKKDKVDKDNNISDIIAMAWCDKTSFDDIKLATNLSESEVIALMRSNLKPSSFRMWRKRVSGRVAKHRARQQYNISNNSDNLDI